MASALSDEPDDSRSFGPLLRQYRVSARLSQEALAERARMSVDAISALERGTRRSPRRDTLDLILNALDAGVSERAALIAAADRSRGRRLSAARSPDEPQVAHNLPFSLTSLHGRDRELVSIPGELAAHRCVTLTGFGGVGKTRLAIETGWSLVGEYPDGVYLVELAPIAEPGLVASRVGSALGVPAQAEQLSGYPWIDALREKRALVILDNCEHVVDAAAEIALALLQRCSHLRVLATSREPLRLPGERIVQILPLGLPPDGDATVTSDALRAAPAIAMFLDRVGDAAPAFALAASDADGWASVRKVCTSLDGIPLALELAAARVPSLGLVMLEHGLRDRFRLLKGGLRTSLPRQQTLLATLDWSYGTLSPQEQRVFDRLGVFAGGFGFDAAAAVCGAAGVADEDCLDLLSSLVEKSLVVADQGPAATRYRLLETTRAYALERLAAKGDLESVRRRHAEYYHAASVRVRGTFGTRPLLEWANEYRGELDNFRSAFAWAIEERGDVRLGAETLCNLIRWVDWLALHAEVLRWCDRAIAAFDGSAPPLLEGEINLLATRQIDALCAFHASTRYAQRAVELYRANDAGVRLADALTFLSRGLAQSAERREDAKAALDEAFAIYADVAKRGTVDERPGEGALTLKMMTALAFAFANYTIEPSDVDGRRTTLNAALDAFRALIPGHFIIGCTIAFLAEVELDAGRYDEAKVRAQESMEYFQRSGVNYGYIVALNASATVSFVRGETDEARAVTFELLRFARRIGSAPGFVMTLLLLATIELETGDPVTGAGLLAAWDASPAHSETPLTTTAHLLPRARAGLERLDPAIAREAMSDAARWSDADAMEIATTAAKGAA